MGRHAPTAGMIDGSLIARKTSDTPPIHRVTLISPMGFLPELRLRCPLWMAPALQGICEGFGALVGCSLVSGLFARS